MSVEESWDRAKKSDTISSYEYFLEKQGDSIFSNEAQERLSKEKAERPALLQRNKEDALEMKASGGQMWMFTLSQTGEEVYLYEGMNSVDVNKAFGFDLPFLGFGNLFGGANLGQPDWQADWGGYSFQLNSSKELIDVVKRR
ncbi:MAG: hypothetical protein SWH61_13525 [Thermodesulfobacteriota bacterium]|nr:hypothetical protein [Thermodesulfobacteriota bacterium]